MLILLLLAFIGAFVSCVIHIYMLLNSGLPPMELVKGLGIGILPLGFFAGFVVGKVRESIQLDKKEFIKAIENTCPYWVKVSTGFILVYGIISFVFCLGGFLAVVSLAKDVKMPTSHFITS
jgi:hypothetical protein